MMVAALIPACENKPGDTGVAHPTSADRTADPTTTPTATATTSTNAQSIDHVRVSIKKVVVGKVPLKAADGSVTYANEPRLMITLRIENTSDKKRSEYNTWVPDLEAAKSVSKLTDDRGNELKRVTFGFGNNVVGRTVLDTLTPGKVIGDLLVFEAPATGANSFHLELPGANCGIKGEFQFNIDAAAIIRPK
jgi:hypothetical protein